MKKNYLTPEVKTIEVSVENGYTLSQRPYPNAHGTEAFTDSNDEFTI